MGKRKNIANNNVSDNAAGSVPQKRVRIENQTELDEDEGVNGAVTINAIKIKAFAENRALEIQALSEVVKNVGGNHMAFQKLPRHMRRRAMSYNLKRVPRRLHSVVRAEIEKTKSPGKGPSRKHRRRPKNLLSEYERRKRRVEWLETHIWHAKRFKMLERWGCKLAHHPNDKSGRACYRAVRHHCAMQDVSFEHYIQIKGERQQILNGLTHLTSQKTGLTFAAKLTSHGTREGTLTLYSYDSYPNKAIGSVKFLWQPCFNQDGQDSTLWICCHRSSYELVLSEVKKCFETTSQALHSEERIETSNVMVTPLKGELVKIRLIGPASNMVLSETLKLYDVAGFLEKDDARLQCPSDESLEAGVEEDDSDYKRQWWKGYYKKENALNVISDQSQVWEQLIKCHSPGEAPNNCVIGLTVRDPRLLLPPKRTKVSVINSGNLTTSLPNELFTESVASSALWDATVRNLVKTTKISEHKLNEMRSHNQIPGSTLDLGEMESAIPVILIQRPGAASMNHQSSVPSGFSSGWDLILPAGWAMAFWIALVYRGARVGGLLEARNIDLLAKKLSTPWDYPDTSSGQDELLGQSKELELKYNRRPPAKRPNYVKLGIPSPFYFQFEKLVGDWYQHLYSSCLDLSDKGKYFVLRDKKILNLLNLALTQTKKFLEEKRKTPKGMGKAVPSGGGHSSLLKAIAVDSTDQIASALVAVHVKLIKRGVPTMNSHICLPNASDLSMLVKKCNNPEPVEKKHPDPFRKQRKEMKKKKGNKKLKSKEEINSQNSITQSSHCSVSSEPEGQNKKVEGADVTSYKSHSTLSNYNLVDCTTRQIAGFVTYGAYSLAAGHGMGIGFCSVLALLQLIEDQQNCQSCTILSRRPSSLQYRFGSISLIV
uniref:Uncharacterized protein n=1 Tax=Biomphalaria glabrata TaxID=6526 RepID=A0A2C9JKD4_BIOGL